MGLRRAHHFIRLRFVDNSIHIARSFSSSQPSPTEAGKPVDLLVQYRELVDGGKIRWDDQQVRAVIELRKLHRRLSGYIPPPHLLESILTQQHEQAAAHTRDAELASASPWWSRYVPDNMRAASVRKKNGSVEEMELVKVLTMAEEIERLDTPKGVFLTGPPGSGKSFLLELLFNNLPPSPNGYVNKTRLHYHSFLLLLYKLVHLEQHAAVTIKDQNEQPDVSMLKEVPEIALRVATRLLSTCGPVILFDEVALPDITSASILRDVLMWYWRAGGVILATSNRLPSDLYASGVQAKRLESFLGCLKSRCPVHELDGGRDWRLFDDESTGEAGEKRWFTDGNDLELENVLGDRSEDGKPEVVSVYKRDLIIPWARNGVCKFTFEELCESALGAADYLTIASNYHTMVFLGVPAITSSKKNEARRLINLIDALYEARCKIYVSSSVPLSQLFFAHEDSPTTASSDSLLEEALSEMENELSSPTRPNVSQYQGNMSITNIDSKEASKPMFSTLGIFTGEDEKFSFKRAHSRLVQMTSSASYQRLQWNPLASHLRGWESAPTTPTIDCLSIPSLSRLKSPNSQIMEETDDWASEATYTSTTSATPAAARTNDSIQKNIPPKIAETHFWGTTEWGSKAGPWGRGFAALRKEGKDK